MAQLEIVQPQDLQPILQELQNLRQLVQEVHRLQQSTPAPNPLGDEKRGLIPLSRAAKLVGVSYKHFRKLVEEGRISAAAVTPGGKPRISRTELIRFINEHGNPTISLHGKVSPRVREVVSQTFTVR